MPETNVYLRWSKTTGDRQIDEPVTVDLRAGFGIGGTFTHRDQAWVAVETANARELGFRRSEGDPGIVFVCDPA
jgi:hypothetical protein